MVMFFYVLQPKHLKAESIDSTQQKSLFVSALQNDIYWSPH